MSAYIYLVCINEHVFKVGMTEQLDPYCRVKSYVNSRLCLLMNVPPSIVRIIETEICTRLRKQFQLFQGREYFIGEENTIKKIVCDVIFELIPGDIPKLDSFEQTCIDAKLKYGQKDTLEKMEILYHERGIDMFTIKDEESELNLFQSFYQIYRLRDKEKPVGVFYMDIQDFFQLVSKRLQKFVLIGDKNPSIKGFKLVPQFDIDHYVSENDYLNAFIQKSFVKQVGGFFSLEDAHLALRNWIRDESVPFKLMSKHDFEKYLKRHLETNCTLNQSHHARGFDGFILNLGPFSRYAPSLPKPS